MGYRDPDNSNLFLIGEIASNFIVGAALERAQELEKMARSKDFAGPEFKRARKAMRDQAHDLHCVISGINTGDGVTRYAARQERNGPE